MKYPINLLHPKCMHRYTEMYILCGQSTHVRAFGHLNIIAKIAWALIVTSHSHRNVNNSLGTTVAWSWDSSIGIATGNRLEDGVGVGVLVKQEFSLLHVVQTGSGVHPTSYTMGTRGSFLGGKAVGA
jgi:hypothetical protein